MTALGATLNTDTGMYAGTLGAESRATAYLEGTALGATLTTLNYPASHYLDPDGTITAQWTGANPHTLLDDAVRQPSVPTIGSDRITSSTNGQVDEVSLETATKRKTITSVIAWWHGANANLTKSSVDLALYSGASQLATSNFTAVSEAWRSVTYNGDLTQGQVDDLRIRLTYNETSSTTSTAIANEVYAEVVY